MLFFYLWSWANHPLVRCMQIGYQCSHLAFWSYGGIRCGIFPCKKTIHKVSISRVFTMIIRQEYWLCGYWIEPIITYRLRCLDFRVFRRAVRVCVESGLLKLLVMKTSGFTTTALEVHSTVMRFAWRHREHYNSWMISPLNPIWQIYVHVQVSSTWLWLVNVLWLYRHQLVIDRLGGQCLPNTCTIVHDEDKAPS